MLSPGLMLPEPKGSAMQVLSELETNICKHRSTGALFGEGKQVKLFCKIQRMKDHCCPSRMEGNCIIYALQLQPLRHKQSNLHKTRQRRLLQSQRFQLRFPVSQTSTLIIFLLCERETSIRERSESPRFSSPRQHCVHCWD